MSLNNLKPAKGSNKTSGKRLGRGQGSGKGGTSTKGHKGAQSRSGYSRKIGFEGGQMPLQRRIPKFGFNNINRIEYKTINVDDIQTLVEDKKIKKDLTFEKMIDLRELMYYIIEVDFLLIRQYSFNSIMGICYMAVTGKI